MVLGDDIDAALPDLRAHAESRMKSTCRIGVRTSGTDPDTLEPVDTVADPIYEGPCRLRFASSTVSERNSGSQQFGDQQGVLSLPVADASVGVKRDMVAVITANPNDPALVGMVLRITGSEVQTTATARRFSVEFLS